LAGVGVRLSIAPRPGGVYTHLHLQVLSVTGVPSGEMALQTSGCVCAPLADVVKGATLDLQQVLGVEWDDGNTHAKVKSVHKGTITIVACVRDEAVLCVGPPPDGHLEAAIGGLHAISRGLDSWDPELPTASGHTPARGLGMLTHLAMPFYARGPTPVPAAAAILFRCLYTPSYGLLSPATRVAVAAAALERSGVSDLASEPLGVVAQLAAYAVSLPISSMPYWDDVVVVPGKGRRMTDRMEPMTLALSGDCDDAGPAVASIAAEWAMSGAVDGGVSGRIASVLAFYIPVVVTAVVSTGSADTTSSSSGSSGVMGHTTCLLVRRDILVFHNGPTPAHLAASVGKAVPDDSLPPIMFAEGTGAMVPVPLPTPSSRCLLNGASTIGCHVDAQKRVFRALAGATPAVHGLNSPFSASGAPTFFQSFGCAVFPGAKATRPADTGGVIEWMIHASVEDADSGVYGVSAAAMTRATSFVCSPLTKFTTEEVSALAREVRLGQSPEPCLFQPGEAGDRCRTMLYHVPFQFVMVGARAVVSNLNALFETAHIAPSKAGVRIVLAYNACSFIQNRSSDVEMVWKKAIASVTMTKPPVADLEVLSDCVVNITITCFVATD